jgi:hypothetical protein
VPSGGCKQWGGGKRRGKVGVGGELGEIPRQGWIQDFRKEGAKWSYLFRKTGPTIKTACCVDLPLTPSLDLTLLGRGREREGEGGRNHA